MTDQDRATASPQPAGHEPSPKGLGPSGDHQAQMTVSEIISKREAAIDAAKAEYWLERERLAARCQKMIDEAEMAYRRDMYLNLCRNTASEAA